MEAEKRDPGNEVDVIGLHAVQFGNNWIRKILRKAKIGRGRSYRPSTIWQSELVSCNWALLSQAIILNERQTKNIVNYFYFQTSIT